MSRLTAFGCMVDPEFLIRPGFSGRVRAVFEPKLLKILDLIRAGDVLFVLDAQKYNQNNLAITLIFFRPKLTIAFFGYGLGFKLVFGFRPGSDLYFRVWSGFEPELVSMFPTLGCSL